jgi:hypothetical protein
MIKATAVIVSLLCLAAAPAAQTPEQDARNIDIHDSNTPFKMPVFTSREAWLERAAFLRKQILASAGLLLERLAHLRGTNGTAPRLLGLLPTFYDAGAASAQDVDSVRPEFPIQRIWAPHVGKANEMLVFAVGQATTLSPICPELL